MSKPVNKNKVAFQLGTTPGIHKSCITGNLLHQRLQTVCKVMLFGLLIFGVRELLTESSQLQLQLALFAFVSVVLGILYLPWQPKMWILRSIEVALFGLLIVFLSYKHYSEICSAHQNGLTTNMLLAEQRMFASFFSIIVVYGVMIPNHWRRSLAVVVAMALIPFITVGALHYKYSSAINMDPWPIAFCLFGILIATYGAHAINTLRQEALSAKQVGQYKLTHKIGSGGMGEVWAANHKMLTRPAAIKKIPFSMLGDEEQSETAIKRFEREAQAIANLRSPHTIEVYDFGQTECGACYYAMELLEGLDLDQLVEKFGALPPERVHYFLKQICFSLGEAHGQGLVHRDIKPANIFVCKLGLQFDFIKVLDFGLVKQTLNKNDPKLTQDGRIAGTPTCIAPEMVKQSSEVDARADIYSVGCVAYWLLTGKYVFAEDSIIETFMAHVQQTPIPISEHVAGVPAALEELVLACLEKDPNARPNSAKDLLSQLEQISFQNTWGNEKANRWWKDAMPDPRVTTERIEVKEVAG